MRGKKWLLTVVCALLLVGVVCVLGNWLIDPFGVFEASPLQWDSYAQTLNPRGSKVRYISERPGEYDSFVVGSSSAASYLPETLERYYGGSFYNMFHYGADTDYDRELVRYLLEQGEVKQIVLVLGLSDAYALHSKTEGLTAVPDYRVSGENEAAYKLRFLFASPSFAMEKLSSLRKDTEMPQTFDVFLPESGTYDKRLRDVESIGSLQDYLTLHGEDYLSETADTTLPDIERCAGNVAAIREMCGEAGTELTVILTPFCREQIEQYDNAALNAFYQALSDVTDYASIFAIGCSIGHDRYYKDTNYSLTPHFGQTEITEMLDSGLISIGSHTYDMHQWPPYETVKPARENMLPLPGESETEYIDAVRNDAAHEAETFAAFGIPKPDVIAFPEGMHTTLTDVVLRECGYKVTLTTDESRVNTVVVGLPQTLIDLGRMTVLPGMTDEQLLQYLNERAN